jgi:hypothetical protein
MDFWWSETLGKRVLYDSWVAAKTFLENWHIDFGNLDRYNQKINTIGNCILIIRNLGVVRAILKSDNIVRTSIPFSDNLTNKEESYVISA